MSSLLAFDYAETAARVRSVSDAQQLINLIDLVINTESFLSQCGPDAARKAAHLASNIFARVPILPPSAFLNRPACHSTFLGDTLEFICQSVLISKILDHNRILPVLEMYDIRNQLQAGFGNVNEQSEPMNAWLARSSPTLITRTRIMLEIARIIRYIHSMDIALYSNDMTSRKRFFLDSNLHAKIMFRGLFARWSREVLTYGHENNRLLTECTYEANIFAFSNLFYEVCFRGDDENTSHRLVGDARRLIERCRAEDLKSRPTMEDVVKEMETWNLT
ncbi:hypothetical protein M378DRAFT_168138 [Amanita muscaria Koide BX008]|uniref:Protein kinase domain-containing protein n=1 Tax=Amanita muscaria (strain Koide BX008) TaxID=946122 RepID=A0A0C2WUF7_AMAMK|nr:hypothetical protein M378DRAFT_168138 [Amanita muscaria Koide BX008]